MDPISVILFLLVVAVILLLLARWLFDFQIITVREGQQQIIFRFGRFNRILKPGLHAIIRRLDTLEQTIDTREQPADVTLDGFFMYDIPFGYMLNLWYRNDPQAAAKGKRDLLTQFVLFSDEERRQQVTAKVRDALLRCASAIQKQRAEATGKPIVYKLLPIFPGMEENNRMMAQLREELANSLPSIGVVMSEAQPIIIKKIILAPHIIANFQRGFTVSMFREFFPDISHGRLMHMLSAIEGLDVSRIQEIALQNETEQADVKLKVDSSGQARVDIRSATPQPAMNTASATDTQKETASPPPSTAEHLTPDDLRVLKRIPRPQRAA